MNLLEDIPKLHTKWQIVEEEFSTKLLTTDLEIHIISLAKINDMSTKDISLNPKLALWSNFLLGNNLEELDMEIDEETLKEMKEAQRICDDINSSAKERYLAELRLKYIRDNKAIEEYGYDKGKKDSKLEMARKMLNSNFSIDKIIEITELTKEEIESLN
jgi:predicted transposase/invertase (TIGR01784 family)